MSEPSSAEVFLSQAEGKEREYDWLGAAEFYRKALNLVPETDSLKIGQIQERIGYALHRTAMQAENADQFRNRMRDAIAYYEKAKESYGELSDSGKAARMLRCDAMNVHLGYWLALEPAEKKRLSNECWRLTKEALQAFEKAQEALEYGKTYNQLSMSSDFGFFLEWDFHVREKTIKEALEHGERAVRLLSTLGDAHELARAYVRTAGYLEAFGFYFLDLDDRERYFQKALSYWQKANELSEETALIELLSSYGTAGFDWGAGSEKAVSNFNKALEYGRKTKDRFIVGCALEWLSFHVWWTVTEDPDELAEREKRIMQYAEGAQRQYSPISFTSPRGDILWIESPHAENYFILASRETNLTKRRELLEKALESTPDLLKRAEDSECPNNIQYAHHVLGKTLGSLAQIEANLHEKKALLEKALAHRNESIRITEQIYPLDHWNLGVMQKYLADVKSQLADLVDDPKTKRNMLEEAVMDRRNSLKLCIKAVAFYEGRGSTSESTAVANWQYQYGDQLKHLYEVTGNREHLRRAVEAFEDAAESLQKYNLKSYMAQCLWKVAQVYDDLGEYLRAAESFNLASNDYKDAAEKIPQLKDFYEDYAHYMQAWSEIEKARHHHVKQEYGSAKEHFEKAANLHKSLKQWSYLTPNYLAWAEVERAEGLSREEQSEEAIKAFEQAAKLFGETKNLLQTQLSKIEDINEKQMATGMMKPSELKREYCASRITLEDARILDKRGDHYSSSEKYGSAAETFERIEQALESEQDRKELRLIVSLSRAWQKMTRAEAEASPTLYVEASQLFEEAKDFSPSEQAKMLMLGHSRFCRALEAGTRFADTRDMNMHAAATQFLDSAANYYMKAGFQKASEYAEATELLFDAYVQMDKAKRESDPEKKAKLYMITEKVLQTSAGSFMKAEHPEKREQVLRLLEKVKKERELAVSVTELLHAPSIVSATTAFTMPQPTHEEAVGSERFEHADIQANIITRQKELKVGENFNLEVELVNAGKGPALLIKLAEVIPEGFEIAEKPEIYRVEDSYLNMKGKRLDPLKTEEVKLVLKPKVQGVFPLKPRILYLDENGKAKSHEPEPITITVKELGIKGWIKGER